MSEEELTPDMLEELEDLQDGQSEDAMIDQQELSQELAEMYGAPEQEERQNAHSFLHKAAFDSKDTIRTTWLSESELGKPLFSVRFLLDMEDVSNHYLLELVKKLKVENKISEYFLNKAYNVTDSGMSNKGFAMNLNVTRKMDTVRKKVREIPPEIKGGKLR